MHDGKYIQVWYEASLVCKELNVELKKQCAAYRKC